MEPWREQEEEGIQGKEHCDLTLVEMLGCLLCASHCARPLCGLLGHVIWT